jgi:hypothetical protein
MNNLTEREKGLLAGAAVVVLAMVYFVARVQPQKALAKSLKEDVASLEQTLASTPRPREAGDPEAVKKQLEEANARLRQARGELDALLQRRVDDHSNQALEGLMQEILTLAKAKGVTVDTSGVYTGSLVDLGIVAKDEIARLQTGNEPFRFRPLRSLSLRGDYPHLRGFIEELPRLRHEVNVLRFSLKADGGKAERRKADTQPAGLRAELVLAL